MTAYYTSVKILKYAHARRSEQSSREWVWLFQDYVSWDALVYLLGILCDRVDGVEGWWTIVDVGVDTRQVRISVHGM